MANGNKSSKGGQRRLKFAKFNSVIKLAAKFRGYHEQNAIYDRERVNHRY